MCLIVNKIIGNAKFFWNDWTDLDTKWASHHWPLNDFWSLELSCFSAVIRTCKHDWRGLMENRLRTDGEQTESRSVTHLPLQVEVVSYDLSDLVLSVFLWNRFSFITNSSSGSVTRAEIRVFLCTCVKRLLASPISSWSPGAQMFSPTGSKRLRAATIRDVWREYRSPRFFIFFLSWSDTPPWAHSHALSVCVHVCGSVCVCECV